MKITRLRLLNFGPIKRGEYTFTLGLNGIIGPNGSGKSTILTAIRYALSGSVDHNVDNYVRIGSNGEESSVALYFTDETGTKRYKIYRKLAPNRQAILNTPDGEIRGAKAIDAYIVDDFGIDLDILRTVQIVSQTDWVSLFKLPGAQRTVLYRRMFGCEVLESKKTMLNMFLGSLAAPTGLAETVRAFEELLDDKNRALAAYVDLPSLQQANEDLEAAKRAKAEMEKQYNAVTYCNGIREELKKIDNYLSENESRYDSTKVYDVAAAHEKVNSLERKALEYDGETFQASCARFNIGPIEDSLECMKDTLDSLKQLEEKYAHSHVTIAYFDEKLEEIDRKIQELNNIDSTCPTCGKPLSESELALLLRDLNEDRLLLLASKADYENDLESFKGYINYLDLSCTGTRGLLELCMKSDQGGRFTKITSQRVLDIMDKLQPKSCIRSLGNYSLASFDVSHMYEVQNTVLQELTDYFELCKSESNKFVELQNKALGEYRECERHYEEQTQLKANLEVAKQKKQDYEAYLEKFDVETQLSLHEMKGQLAVLGLGIDKAYKTINAISAANTLRKDIAELQKKLDDYKEKLQMDEKLADRKSVLEGVVSLLASDRFPRFVISSWLKMIEASINNYLAAFNAPFRAEAQDNTDIVCKFNDGKTLDAWALSGGQQVVLAVAWRLALHYTFSRSESCGFLTLDEPTTFLDSDNIDNLVSVLNSVKTIAENSGLQVLVITHASQLSPLFDNVIQINGNN